MDIFLLTTPPSHLMPHSPLSSHNRKSKNYNHDNESSSPTNFCKFNNNTPLKSKELHNNDNNTQHPLSISEKINMAKIRRNALLVDHISNTHRRATKKHRLADQRATRHIQSKITRARLDISRSKAIARRVKAARAIQRFVRSKWNVDDDDDGRRRRRKMTMGQKEASRKLQRWKMWRLAVCRRRWRRRRGHEELTKILTEMEDAFESFDDMSRLLTRRDVIEWATTVVTALLPLQHVNFGSRVGRARCFLSSFVIVGHADVVLELNEDDDEDDDDKRHATIVRKAAVALLQSLKDLTNSDDDMVDDGTLLTVASERLTTFEVLFDEWKKRDLEHLVSKLMNEAEETWTIYLATSTSDRDEDNECREGAKDHLKRLRRSLNRIVGSSRGRDVMREAKAKARAKLESEEENRNTTLCVIVI